MTAPWTEEPELPAGGYPTGDALERIKDQVRYLSDRPILALRRNANQNIANVTFDAMDWDTEDLDQFDMWTSTAVDTVTFTRAGFYAVHFATGWAANATGNRTVILRVNGVLDIGSGTSPGDATVSGMCASTYHNAAVGDTLVCILRQSSGGALNVTGRLLIVMERG